MAPTIHCLRHGQGLHNLGAGFYDLPDPQLTPLGEQQCQTLRQTSFPDQSKMSLITASPLRRTLHTASLIFHPALTSPNHKCKPRILALPSAQETSNDACDVGSSPSTLHATTTSNNWPVDLSLVHEGWNNKIAVETNRYSPHSKAIKARARDTRIFLREKIREMVDAGDGDAQVVLVSHGGFLHYFTEDWEDAALFPGTGWGNCEVRSYVFERGVGGDGGGDSEARLVETRESREVRGKMYPMFASEKQMELFRLGMQGWESQGLQRPDLLGVVMDVSTSV